MQLKLTGRQTIAASEFGIRKIACNLAEYGIIKRRLLQGEREDADDWKIGHWLCFRARRKGPDMLRFRVPVDDLQTAQWYYSIHPLNEGETQTSRSDSPSMKCRHRY